MNAGGTQASTARARRIRTTILVAAGGAVIVASVVVLVPKARADGGGGSCGGGVKIPTGGCGPSYAPVGMGKFNQPMPRFDVLRREPVSSLSAGPTEQSIAQRLEMDHHHAL